MEAALWETVLRGSAIYLAVAVLLRLIPKRQTGNLSPNDLIALVIIGNLAGDAIAGEDRGPVDLVILVLVVLLWDWAFNLAEYYYPRFRRVAQDSPTLLVHNGRVLKENLRKEKLTEQELRASLRKQGVLELARVKVAVLEVDGEVSVVEKHEK